MAAVKLGSKAEGDIVKIRENGVLADFYVAKHDYESDLNGTGRTLLVRKDCCASLSYNNPNINVYHSSDISSWLNSTYKGRLDGNIRAAMGTTKFRYTNTYTANPGTSGVSKPSTLERSIFLLSATELGMTHSHLRADGTVLDVANKLKIARLNGTATKQWTRSPYSMSTLGYSSSWCLTAGGALELQSCTIALGIRPVFTLPATLSVNDDGEVLTNDPPTTPPSLTLPDKIQGGGKTTITWGVSTDPDGNLEGYVLERSLDGGSSWTQVYQGGGRSTTNTVPFGSDTVMYRVRAYDSEGAYSAYRTSAQVAVDNNTAPNTPGAINVPAAVNGGGSLVVTWSASYDAEGNLAGYALERRVGADGPWTEVYRGTALSFQDAITKGWPDVAYRVKAYDSYGAESGWAVSPTRTVDNNTAPTVASDSAADLGTQNEGFTVPYTVDDADGDVVTVQEALDGAVKRRFTAVLGQPNAFDVTGEYFQRVLNGAHRLEVTATDAGGKSSALAVTFSKQVTACSITLEQPMEADAPITVCVLSVTGSIPADAEYTLEVTNNALDDAPVWEDCIVAARNGANHVFANQEAVNGFAFNFRLRAARGPGGAGGYITSVQGGFQ